MVLFRIKRAPHFWSASCSMNLCMDLSVLGQWRKWQVNLCVALDSLLEARNGFQQRGRCAVPAVRHVVADVDEHSQAPLSEAVAALPIRLYFLQGRQRQLSMHLRATIAKSCSVPGSRRRSGPLTHLDGLEDEEEDAGSGLGRRELHDVRDLLCHL